MASPIVTKTTPLLDSPTPHAEARYIENHGGLVYTVVQMATQNLRKLFASDVNAILGRILDGRYSGDAWDLWTNGVNRITSDGFAYFPYLEVEGSSGQYLLDVQRKGSGTGVEVVRIRTEIGGATGYLIMAGLSDFGSPVETFVEKFSVDSSGNVIANSIAADLITSLLHIGNANGDIYWTGDGFDVVEANMGGAKKSRYAYQSLDLSGGLTFTDILPTGKGVSNVRVLVRVATTITGTGGIGSVTVGVSDGTGTEWASALALASASKAMPGDGSGDGGATYPTGASFVVAPDVGAITGGVVEVVAFWDEFSIP